MIRRVWSGYARLDQVQVIEAFRLIVILPTSSGKSLCFVAYMYTSVFCSTIIIIIIIINVHTTKGEDI